MNEFGLRLIRWSVQLNTKCNAIQNAFFTFHSSQVESDWCILHARFRTFFFKCSMDGIASISSLCQRKAFKNDAVHKSSILKAVGQWCREIACLGSMWDIVLWVYNHFDITVLVTTAKLTVVRLGLGRWPDLILIWLRQVTQNTFGRKCASTSNAFWFTRMPAGTRGSGFIGATPIYRLSPSLYDKTTEFFSTTL